jgi:hypothetical protein
MRLRKSLPVLVILINALWAPAVDSTESELVMVQAEDGRVLIGEVDQRTDDRMLWLRTTSPNLVLSTALPWNEIAWVQHANRRFKPSRFRGMAAEFASPVPADFFQEPQVYTRPEPTHEDGSYNGRVYVVPPSAVKTPAQTVVAQAHVANWDGDAETDGLVIKIAPRASSGDMAPLDGVLVVELLGRKYRSAPRRSPIVELEEWSLRVRNQDFGALGATYRLPFQTFFPDRDHSIAREGRLRVRLTGGRTGPLEASVLVPLR